MAWVPDSRTPGYLGPLPTRDPPHDDSWENWLHNVFAGITGLPDELVRPRWQPEPPNRPEIDTDWLAFGVVSRAYDFTPWIGHVDEGDGYDALQEHEINNILCSFYGPNCDRFASLLRRGFFQDQNRALCREAGVGLVEIAAMRSAPELFNERWWPRSDVDVILRREIRLDYPVLTILRAKGPIHANDQGSRVVEAEFDTARLGTVWDSGNPEATVWDDGKTSWDRA